MMKVFRRLELLRPSVIVDTLKDGRSGIVTWVPPDDIVEFAPIGRTSGAVGIASEGSLPRWQSGRL